MARFTLPRDIYHGKGCLEELKNNNAVELSNKADNEFMEKLL